MSSNLVTLLYQLSSQATSQPSQMTAWSPSHQLTAAAFGSTHSRTDSFYPELQYFLRLTPSMMIADVDLRDTVCVSEVEEICLWNLSIFTKVVLENFKHLWKATELCHEPPGPHHPATRYQLTANLGFFCLFVSISTPVRWFGSYICFHMYFQKIGIL